MALGFGSRGCVVIDDEWVDLADAVRVVREQLDIARETGESEQTRFEVGSVEVELAVQVTKDVNATGGIRLGVVSFDARGGGSSASTHRVKLALTPRRDGKALEINKEVADLPPAHPGPAPRQP